MCLTCFVECPKALAVGAMLRAAFGPLTHEERTGWRHIHLSGALPSSSAPQLSHAPFAPPPKVPPEAPQTQQEPEQTGPALEQQYLIQGDTHSLYMCHYVAVSSWTTCCVSHCHGRAKASGFDLELKLKTCVCSSNCSL